jgi:hypothetical protein
MRLRTEDLEDVYHIRDIDWELLYRAYHGLISVTVLYQYMTNPKAEADEYLPDVALHALEALIPNRWTLFALGANGLRAVQAGWAVISGVSSIPLFANKLDIGNHLLTMYHRYQNSEDHNKFLHNPHHISRAKLQ